MSDTVKHELSHLDILATRAVMDGERHLAEGNAKSASTADTKFWILRTLSLALLDKVFLALDIKTDKPGSIHVGWPESLHFSDIQDSVVHLRGEFQDVIGSITVSDQEIVDAADMYLHKFAHNRDIKDQSEVDKMTFERGRIDHAKSA